MPSFFKLHIDKKNQFFKIILSEKSAVKKKYLVNEQIPYEKVRVIDEEGKNLGIMDLKEGIEMARQKGLSLVLISEKAEPPVCKILDYGKFLYSLEKSEKKGKEKEMKVIRLSYNISEHDLETKGKMAEKFLKEGHRVKIEMILRGREKMFSNLAKEKMEKFFNALAERVAIQREGEIQSQPKGLILIVRKK